jgi:hypothetical protein
MNEMNVKVAQLSRYCLNGAYCLVFVFVCAYLFFICSFACEHIINIGFQDVELLKLNYYYCINCLVLYFVCVLFFLLVLTL